MLDSMCTRRSRAQHDRRRRMSERRGALLRTPETRAEHEPKNWSPASQVRYGVYRWDPDAPRVVWNRAWLCTDPEDGLCFMRENDEVVGSLPWV